MKSDACKKHGKVRSALIAEADDELMMEPQKVLTPAEDGVVVHGNLLQQANQAIGIEGADGAVVKVLVGVSLNLNHMDGEVRLPEVVDMQSPKAAEGGRANPLGVGDSCLFLGEAVGIESGNACWLGR
mmetsp:Transcript_11221/g.16979  ORF Transcript_11221/g.16979 Transcript_11221/m.16979 type:complete len:128 (-) Transcript_11221:20-403(-)